MVVKIDRSKLWKAHAAFNARLNNGWTHDEALRNTRQEFDLSDAEEEQMLKDHAADKIIEALS